MKTSFKINPLIISLLVIGISILAYLSGIPFLDLMEFKTIDLRFGYRGRISPNPKIVLAVIDEKSLAREGKWVWPRSKLADLITKVSDAGAKVIAFDVGFFEPDGKRVVDTLIRLESELERLDSINSGVRDYLEKLKRESDNDRLLADAASNSKAKVVLGYFFHMAMDASLRMNDEEIRAHEENIVGSEYHNTGYANAKAQNAPLIDAALPQSNIRTVSEATDYAGFFNMEPDPDGVVRWMPAVFRFNEVLYAPLSLIAVSAYLGSPLSIRISEFGVEKLSLGDVSIPTDERGRILINYHGGAKTFPHISITDILRGEVTGDDLRDKIVLVGATATGIYDMRVTPFDAVFPGMEIHANLMGSFLSKNFLNRPNWGVYFDIAAIIAAGLLLWLVLPRAGVAAGAVTFCFLFAGYILVCQYLFSHKGWILNLVYPLSVTVLIYVSITAYKYLVEARQKRFVRSAFSTYLAPSVVSQLIESPEKLVLGGENRVITAFFSDVQGFTGISEKLTPGELVELLNEFLTEMTDVILTHEGRLWINLREMPSLLSLERPTILTTRRTWPACPVSKCRTD